MRFTLVAGLAALASIVAASPLAGHVLHEKRHTAPKKWVKRSEVHEDLVLPMRIGMVQRNVENGYDLLMEVSHHDSPKYGQHYTEDEINELFAPSHDSVEAVRNWLLEHGISAEKIKQSFNKQWMQVDIPVKEAHSLLKTKFHYWEHLPSGKKNIACDEYHVPYQVKEHIDYITPGVVLFSGTNKAITEEAKKRKRDLAKRGFPGPGSNPFPILPPVSLPAGTTIESLLSNGLINECNTAITPPCIAALYNITKGTKAAKNNQMGIFEDTDFYNAADLTEFIATLAPEVPVDRQPILKGVDGGFAPLVATGESNLDLQISYPIINPQNSVLFQTDDLHYELDYTFTGLFNNLLSAIDGSYCTPQKEDPPYPDNFNGSVPEAPVGTPADDLVYTHKLQCGVYKPTNVISFSYGEQEDDLPDAYQRRQCNEFMKLGMRGISLVFASGDSGVAARSTDDGNANGCQGQGAAAGKIFNPDFPASCPYLITTGSTFLPAKGNVHKDEEVSTTSFPSGGGFSNLYNRPAYQNAAVEHYFKVAPAAVKAYPYYRSNNNDSYGAHGGIYNRNGRGYPDFSAIGDNVLIFLEGAPVLIGGTSAAAPVFAAILNRINEERLAVGKSTVGFVNPVLYAHPTVLHDITTGSNPGCGTKGFIATKGWDPVSGLGTPNYPAMLKLFMRLK